MITLFGAALLFLSLVGVLSTVRLGSVRGAQWDMAARRRAWREDMDVGEALQRRWLTKERP